MYLKDFFVFLEKIAVHDIEIRVFLCVSILSPHPRNNFLSECIIRRYRFRRFQSPRTDHMSAQVLKTLVLDLTQIRNSTSHTLSKPWPAENADVQRLCAVRRAARSSGRARNVCCRPAYPISIRVRGGAAIITAQVSFDWILGDFNMELARIEDRQRHSCKLA